MAGFGKRLRKAYQGIDRRALLDVGAAMSLLKQTPVAKFDETVEIALNLGVDTRHADQQVRGKVVLPYGTGKTIRVAVFARGDKATEAEAAGADLVGAEDLAERIQGGFLVFDRCIATPDLMGVVGRLGKILGPRNLMPNPKLGTVTPNVAAAVRDAKGGEVQFRAEKAGLVHAGIGKVSFDEAALLDNLRAFVAAVRAARPSGAKGVFIRKAALSSTMGPGIHLDPATLAADA